ncbi:MAG: caspase family protein [Alphaproteobacteria bacterium]|nr:caspase family protein [Alphaproteobacteria bacterium]
MSRYAVIVGINDYATAAASTGAAPGSLDLHGAVADARAWYRLLTDELERPEQSIRLLIGDRSIQEAGGDDIRDAVDWLIERLKGRPDAQGVLIFCGRGSYCTDRGALLCPQDVTGPSLEGAISTRELAAALDGSGRPVATALDCSFVAPPNLSLHRDRFLPCAGAEDLGPTGWPWTSQRGLGILTRPDPGAIEVEQSGQLRGLLSWACVQALSGCFRPGHTTRLDGNELIDRVNQLALGVGLPAVGSLATWPNRKVLEIWIGHDGYRKLDILPLGGGSSLGAVAVIAPEGLITSNGKDAREADGLEDYSDTELWFLGGTLPAAGFKLHQDPAAVVSGAPDRQYTQTGFPPGTSSFGTVTLSTGDHFYEMTANTTETVEGYAWFKGNGDIIWYREPTISGATFKDPDGYALVAFDPANIPGTKQFRMVSQSED